LVLPGDFGSFVGIQFHDFETALILLRQFLNNGGNHLAWTAPHRPEIHHHNIRGFYDFPIPIRCIGYGYKIGH
jgi:hypothetical protein